MLHIWTHWVVYIAVGTASEYVTSHKQLLNCLKVQDLAFIKTQFARFHMNEATNFTLRKILDYVGFRYEIIKMSS